jgi:hypothetical protein
MLLGLRAKIKEEEDVHSHPGSASATLHAKVSYLFKPYRRTAGAVNRLEK